MASRSGDDMVKDFYQRGAGELAVARLRGDPEGTATQASQQASRTSKGATCATAADASDKQLKLIRKRNRRLMLACARLLASSMR